eukprot:scaffold2830_cov131-Cylindrotheca_fusiformis.AAC.78
MANLMMMFSKLAQNYVKPSLGREVKVAHLSILSFRGVTRSSGSRLSNFHQVDFGAVAQKPWQQYNKHIAFRSLTSAQGFGHFMNDLTATTERHSKRTRAKKDAIRMRQQGRNLHILSSNQPAPLPPSGTYRRIIDVPQVGTGVSFSSSTSTNRQAGSPEADTGGTNSVPPERSAPIGVAESYHLLWTPGFVKKFGYSTVGLLICHNAMVGSGVYIPITDWLSTAPVASSLGLSLLASSCCLFQVFANVFAGTVGCLGLNTALGPSRPYFMSVLFYFTFVTSSTSLPHILLRSSIAFLPEFMFAWNKRHTVFSNQQNASDDFSGTRAVLEFDVPTMGCVACINRIDSTIRNKKDQKLLDVTSWLDPSLPKGGATKVTLAVDSKEEAAKIGQALVETLDSIGFGGSSVSKVALLENESARGP